MHDHCSEYSLEDAILAIVNSAITQVCARLPIRSRKRFAEDCGWSYQQLQNRFSKDPEKNKYLTKTKFKNIGTMLKVIKEWDEEIYIWTVKEIVFGTMEKFQQMKMFIGLFGL